MDQTPPPVFEIKEEIDDNTCCEIINNDPKSIVKIEVNDEDLDQLITPIQTFDTSNVAASNSDSNDTTSHPSISKISIPVQSDSESMIKIEVDQEELDIFADQSSSSIDDISSEPRTVATSLPTISTLSSPNQTDGSQVNPATAIDDTQSVIKIEVNEEELGALTSRSPGTETITISPLNIDVLSETGTLSHPNTSQVEGNDEQTGVESDPGSKNQEGDDDDSSEPEDFGGDQWDNESSLSDQEEVPETGHNLPQSKERLPLKLSNSASISHALTAELKASLKRSKQSSSTNKNKKKKQTSDISGSEWDNDSNSSDEEFIPESSRAKKRARGSLNRVNGKTNGGKVASIHTGESASFTCGECGKSFSRKGHLKEHEMIHSGERKFKCDDCGLSFNRGQNLKRHLTSQRHQRSSSKSANDPGDNLEKEDETEPEDFYDEACEDDSSLSDDAQSEKHTGESSSEEQEDEEEDLADGLDDPASISQALTAQLKARLKRPKVPGSSKKKKRTKEAEESDGGHSWENDSSSSDESTVKSSGPRKRPRISSSPMSEQKDESQSSISDQPSPSKENTEPVNDDPRRPKCLDCGKSFSTKSALKLHAVSHTGEKNFQCDQCGKAFARKGILKVHMVTHTGEKNFKCDQCGKAFALKDNLVKHQYTHTGERWGKRKPPKKGPQVKCSECGAKFYRQPDLNRHVRIIHVEGKVYKCTECDKSFNQKTNLKRHMVIHTGERKFKCEQCGSAFKHKQHLEKHYVSHSGERSLSTGKKIERPKVQKPKKFKCTECDKAFAESCNLKTHMRTHTGERPYKCSECDYSSAQSTALKEHMRIHTGERPYACSQCDQKFAKKTTLTGHMQTHTGERKFKCEHCDKAFVRRNQLTRHMKKHDGQE